MTYKLIKDYGLKFKLKKMIADREGSHYNAVFSFLSTIKFTL